MQVWQESGPSWALGVIALGLLVVAVGAWRQRSLPTATPLALLCLTLAIWTLADGLSAAAALLGLKLFLTKIEWLCVLCVVPLWLQFTNAFARRPPAPSTECGCGVSGVGTRKHLSSQELGR